MVERGLMRRDLNPIILLRSTLGNIGMLIAQRKLLGDKFAFDDFEVDIDKMIDVLLYGIAPVNQVNNNQDGGKS
jgi:hypothetical protein